MANFRQFDRATGFLLPPSLDEWLPEQHLARFVVEVIDGLDLSAMVKSYRGSGSASYHPALLLGLLVCEGLAPGRGHHCYVRDAENAGPDRLYPAIMIADDNVQLNEV